MARIKHTPVVGECPGRANFGCKHSNRAGSRAHRRARALAKGKRYKGILKGACGKLDTHFLWLLQTPYWCKIFWNHEADIVSRARNLHRFRPLLKSQGVAAATRLGWPEWVIRRHFGGTTRFSDQRLVYFLQVMERLEFDLWHSLSHGFHPAPLGVQLACKASWPALFGGVDGLPCLPGDIAEIIMEWVVFMSFQDYARGATGVRASLIKFGPLRRRRHSVCPKAAFLKLALVDCARVSSGCGCRTSFK